MAGRGVYTSPFSPKDQTFNNVHTGVRSSPPQPHPCYTTLVTKGGWRTPAEIGPTHAALTLDLIRVMPA